MQRIINATELTIHYRLFSFKNEFLAADEELSVRRDQRQQDDEQYCTSQLSQ